MFTFYYSRFSCCRNKKDALYVSHEYKCRGMMWFRGGSFSIIYSMLDWSQQQIINFWENWNITADSWTIAAFLLRAKQKERKRNSEEYIVSHFTSPHLLAVQLFLIRLVKFLWQCHNSPGSFHTHITDTWGWELSYCEVVSVLFVQVQSQVWLYLIKGCCFEWKSCNEK